MATVQSFTLSREQMWGTLIPYLENNWIWNGGVEKTGNGELGSIASFYIDEAKTICIKYTQGQTGMTASTIATIFKGTEQTTWKYNLNSNTTFLIEITNTALMFTFNSGDTISANSGSYKYIVHNAINPKTNTTKQILTLMRQNGSGNWNVSFADDVVTPKETTEYPLGNIEKDGQMLIMTPICNKASDYISTDTYRLALSPLSGYSYNDTIINGHHYRMSSCVFALDE